MVGFLSLRVWVIWFYKFQSSAHLRAYSVSLRSVSAATANAMTHTDYDLLNEG